MKTENYIPSEEDLTAYALGEADEIQAAMIEKALESQPESRALLNEIKETIALSEATFAELKGEALSDEQRAKIARAAESVIPMRRTPTWQKLVGYAAAAGIVAAVGLTVIVPSMTEQKVAYELTPERVELIKKYEATQSGKSSADIDFGQYANTSDDEMVDGIVQFANETGLGRFVITDINNPGATGAMPREEYAERLTEELIVEAHQRRNLQENRAAWRDPIRDDDTLSDSSSGEADGVRRQVAEYEEQVREVDAQRMNAQSAQSNQSTTDLATEPPQSAPKPAGVGGGQGGGPQNGIIPEGTRIRGNSFFPPNQSTPQSVAGRAAGSATPTLVQSQEERSFTTAQGDPNQQFGVSPSPAVAGVELQITASASQESVASDRFYVAGQPADAYQYIPPRPEIQPVPITPGTEAYDRIVENTFKRVTDAPLSTFSIDVDTASYANMRRFLNQAQLPPADAVRIEEMINYFDYDYPQPTGEDPFSANIEVAQSPWNAQHKLVRVGLKGKEIAVEERPATNLVFLLDVSGSMNNANKLPLLKQSLRLLTEQLTENDRVAIAVYAGNSGLVLNSTPGNMHNQIIDALNRLQAGGSTNGGAGIQLAYDIASQNFIPGGVNRVILATDGDFNVGTTNRDDLVNLIEAKAKSGVFLSVLGFGMGNLKDATMEKLADKGNGNYAYIDTFAEAKKVLATEMSGTLFTIAKDVKIQVEFNPARVQAYRLIGYENRALADRDFNDDTKDAGEIGAGHTVTALYEIVPTGVAMTTRPGVDELRYQTPAPAAQPTADIESVDPAVANELLTVKLRYKQPDGQVSKLLTFPVQDADRGYNSASTDFKFATAVAAFGMKLRNSPFASTMSYDTVLSIAESGVGSDLNGYRSEFLSLVRQARSLSPEMVQRY